MPTQPLMSSVSTVPQAQSLATKLPPIPAEDAAGPRVLIPSALKLTREQEDALIAHAVRRKQELTSELGVRDFDSPNWHQTALDSEGRFQRRHFDTRHMALMSYEMNYDWRPAVLGGIFTETNLHIPITRRILQQVIARMVNYFVGTAPYFSVDPQGIEDTELASKISEYLKYDLDTKNDTSARIAQGIERALVTGEADFAISYSARVSYYQTEKEVLVDAAGNAIPGANLDYIIKGEDEWVPQQVPGIDPESGQPVMKPGAQTVLKRDGITPLPSSGEIYAPQIIWRKSSVAEGPQADLLMPFDFLAPLNAKNLDEADFCCLNYDEPLIQLIHRLQMFSGVPARQMVDYISRITSRLAPHGTTNPSAAANKASSVNNEPKDGLGADRAEPQINWSRCCLFYDVLGEGMLADILLIMTADGTQPLFYDYVQNCTPDHRRPFRRITVNKKPGRCIGQGLVEIFEHLQTDADLIFNRWNFSLSRAGVVVGYNPEHCVEGETNPDLQINGGETLHPKPGKTLDDIIQTKSIVEIKSMPLKEMLEFILQLSMNMSGVANVNDGQTAGLDTTKLATGVRNLEKSGQELTDKIVSDLRPGIEDLLKGLMSLSCANLTEEKSFRFFNGNVGVLATIKPAEVKNLDIDVDLELTKYHGEQEVAQGTQAMNAGMQFYKLAPEAQQLLAGVFQKLMKAYGIKDPPGPMSPAPPMPAPGTPVPPAEVQPAI